MVTQPQRDVLSTQGRRCAVHDDGRTVEEVRWDTAPVEDGALVADDGEDIHEVEHALEGGGAVQHAHDVLDVPDVHSCKVPQHACTPVTCLRHAALLLQGGNLST